MLAPMDTQRKPTSIFLKEFTVFMDGHLWLSRTIHVVANKPVTQRFLLSQSWSVILHTF